MATKSSQSIEMGLALFGLILYFFLHYGVILLHLLNVEMTRSEEVAIIARASIAEFVLAVLMLIRGFVWIFFLRNKASLKYRILLVGIYFIPTVNLVYFFILIITPHMPY